MVTRRGRPQGSQHIGIALSVSGLCATYALGRSSPVVRRLPLDPPAADAVTWPSLAKAFMQLKSDLGGERISIALVPPLAEVRSIDLPPLRDDESELVLMRAAARYFVTARQPQLVGVVRRGRGARGGSKTVVAAAAPARLVAAIRTAARDAGFVIAGIGPAESAWGAAATSLWPPFASGPALVVVSHVDRTDLLRLDEGRLTAVRRFQPGAADAGLIADSVRNSGPSALQLAAFGTRDERTALLRELSAAGVTAAIPDHRGNAVTDATSGDADLLAARFAAPREGPIFRTDDVRAASRADAWRATALAAAAAVVLLVGGAAVRLWGLHRQLDAVRAERARLAPKLSATLVGRTSVEAVYRSLAGLNALERSAPNWSHTIADLTSVLPDAAYLTAFRTRGDSVVVEGLAEQASDVFNAMEQMPSLANVRAGAPVRRELQEDTIPLERFTIVALQPSVAPNVGSGR